MCGGAESELKVLFGLAGPQDLNSPLISSKRWNGKKTETTTTEMWLYGDSIISVYQGMERENGKYRVTEGYTRRDIEITPSLLANRRHVNLDIAACRHVSHDRLT